MKRADRSFLIAGHTDNTPVKADATAYHSNWELSVLRATNAVAFLQQAGVPPTQLGAAGSGEHMPDATNDNEKGRKENRRLEIIVMPKLDEIPPLPTTL
jgi:chemotaxis protein MotB